MSRNFMFEDEFERAERSKRARYRDEKRLNEITRQHPEAVAVVAAGIGIFMLCLALAFVVSECTYRYRLGHWVEQTAVYDSRCGDHSLKCHYEVDGETRYAIVPRVHSTYTYYRSGDSVTIYLNPSNKYQYIGKKDFSDEVTGIAMCPIILIIAAACFSLSHNAYTKHYLFNGPALFSQRMADMGISTKQFDEFYH